MSEKIIKALMQLFAIIAVPGSDLKEKLALVESFLNKQINEDLLQQYLKIFENYYISYQQKQKDRGQRVIPLSSVRVLKICTEINEELTQQQKIVVLVQLLEFIKPDKHDSREISDQEMEFVETVADTFNLSRESYKQIRDFVFTSFDQIPDFTNLLIVSKNQYLGDRTKFVVSAHLEGQIRILNVESANVYIGRYIGESEMYLNSQLLQNDKVFVFRTGSSIRNRNITPIYYSEIVSYFNEDKIKSKIAFEVKNIYYKFKDGGFGLNDISFTEESGHLVGIMGASGSGKSTLLNTLNGSYPPTMGSVCINGLNIHTQKQEVKGLIGHVPQDDLLIEELTVYQNLYYNAKLCFDNYTEEQVIQAVNTTLKDLGLFDIRNIQVGSPLNQKISGGQRKRLNIALELIREPSILFLDEPTSGLSSRDSENILDLLKELALKGKLVFVVIHQPSSDIFKMFDHLIILDTGGYLIYNGNPTDSIVYFKSRVHHANWSESECPVCGNVNPEQIFNIIEANVVDEYGNLTGTRKITPKEWKRHYIDYLRDKEKVHEIPTDVPAISFKIPDWANQFKIFMKRDMLAKLTNTQYLVINFLEAPVLAFLLSFIVKYFDVNSEVGYTLMDNANIPVYIFMSVIVAIFMGLTVSAEEIIKDRKILKREKFLNLSWSSYLCSKIAVLFIISAIQALTFVLIGNSIVEIRGMYWQYWLVMFTAWTSSNIMGLVISDSFKTVVTIYILIPFLVIPQLILSGIIVKFEKINPFISAPNKIPIYGEIITARWAYEALAVYTFKENRFEKNFYTYEKAMSRADYKKNYWLPTIKNKLTYYQKYRDTDKNQDKVKEDLLLLYNELHDEFKTNDIVTFAYADSVKKSGISDFTISKLLVYFEGLNTYYVKLYNKANDHKDRLISEMQMSVSGREEFIRLKQRYTNDDLTEFVANSNEMQRILEYDGRLYQKIDPVYQDPKSPFLKAHFYAPHKNFFGVYIDTFWANILVMWIITGLLYIVLYFRLFKRFLDRLEHLNIDSFTKPKKLLGKRFMKPKK